jgi:hypothetical protein
VLSSTPLLVIEQQNWRVLCLGCHHSRGVALSVADAEYLSRTKNGEHDRVRGKRPHGSAPTAAALKTSYITAANLDRRKV